MTIYYDTQLNVHEHQPNLIEPHKYLEKERQWLLIDTKSTKIAFLRQVDNISPFSQTIKMSYVSDIEPLLSHA